jgi:phytoene dehydrogenase-like protein
MPTGVCLLLERHYAAGGFTQVFRRPGLEWDVGLHYIGQVQDPESETRRMFDHITDGRLQWARMPDVYDRLIIRDRTFDFHAGVDHFRERMQSYFPQDVGAIDQYIQTVNRCVARIGLFFAEKLIPPFLGALLGGAFRHPYLYYASRTTADVLQEMTKNPELIAVLAGQWGDYGLPPTQSSFGIHAIIAKHYFDGATYPIGGAGAILSSMAPIITSTGGNIVVNAEVESIIVEDGCVAGLRMADGVAIRAPIVISDTGAANTYSRLLCLNTPAVDRIRHAIATIPPASWGKCCFGLLCEHHQLVTWLNERTLSAARSKRCSSITCIIELFWAARLIRSLGREIQRDREPLLRQRGITPNDRVEMSFVARRRPAFVAGSKLYQKVTRSGAPQI